jgi:hypothetical protein
MPWRLQIRSAISRANGSMLELLISELMMSDLMADDRTRPVWRQFDQSGPNSPICGDSALAGSPKKYLGSI